MYQNPSLLTSHPLPKVIPLQWRSPHTSLPSTLFFAVLFWRYLWMVAVWCFLFYFFYLTFLVLFDFMRPLLYPSFFSPSFLTYLLERSSDGTNGGQRLFCDAMHCWLKH